jgi:hypothetical protein
MAHLPQSSFSRSERAAFNAGVRSVVEHATAAADAIETMPGFKEARQGFATVALRALVEAERDLTLGDAFNPAN